jgi:hypothetical protein
MQLLAAVPGHVHPVPDIDTSVISKGTASVTVTVPLVGLAPVAFDTVTVYTAPVCACMKFPIWLFTMLNTGAFGTTNVLSIVLALADPPPDTPTALISGEAALMATLTNTVMAG